MRIHTLLVSFLVACAPGVAPAPVPPSMPAVEAMRDWLPRAQPVTADLAVCVEASGDVREARVVHSSGDRSFDSALLVDVAHWRLPSPHGREECRPARVTYVP